MSGGSGSAETSAVVTGRSANGRTSWKRPDGQTYADWEAAQIAAAAP